MTVERSRYSDVWRMIDAEFPFSPRERASNHVEWLDPRHPGCWPRRVVIYCRVSGRDQDWRRSLERQIAWMRRELLKRGIVVVKVYWDVVSGWNIDSRPGLDLAIEHAVRDDIPIVAESTCRLLRAWDYHSEEAPEAVPTVSEFEKFVARAPGVRFFTWLEPDADWRDVRSHQTKRGIGAKHAPGEKNRWRATVGVAAVLAWLEGDSYRKVAEQMCTPLPTVQGWIRGFVLGCMDFLRPTGKNEGQR